MQVRFLPRAPRRPRFILLPELMFQPSGAALSMKYSPDLPLTVKYKLQAFPFSDDLVTRRAVGAKQVTKLMAEIRELVRFVHQPRRLYVATRQSRLDKAWRVGRFQRDSRGRVRWYDGWHHHNGLLMLACSLHPFPRKK